MSDEDDDLFNIFNSPTEPETVQGANSPPPVSESLKPQGPLHDGSSTEGISVATNSSSTQSSASEYRRLDPSDGLTFLSAPANGAEGAPQPSRALEAVEKHSGLRIRRPTRSFEQLEVCLAQYPFVTFSKARSACTSTSAGSPLAHTIVGVVVRKTDPKQGARSRYAVVTLWNARGLSPAPTEELSLLLCGSAYELTYSHLTPGSVIAVTNLQPMPRTERGGDGMLKLHEMEHLRQLGYAADLGTCASTNRQTGERCHSFVNQRLTQHCIYHCGDAKRQLTQKPAQPRQTMKPLLTVASAKRVAGPPSRLAGNTVMSVASSAVPVPGHRQEALRLLRQRSNFLTVNAKTGLPMDGGGSTQSQEGSGIYGGVTSGGQLTINALSVAGRNGGPLASTRQLGVTSRGRDVLAALRENSDRQEQQRLLKAALHNTPAPETSTPTPELSSSMKRPRAPTTSDVAPGNRASAVPRSRVDASALAALKQQFSPLAAAPNSCPSRPMSSGGMNSVVTRQVSCSQRVVTQQTDGRTNLVVEAVAKALDHDAKARTGDAHAWRREAKVSMTAKETGTAQSLIGAVAAVSRSSNDALREEAEQDRISALIEREIARDAVREALDAITEQPVKAVFCHTCQKWFIRPPDTCVAGKHRLEAQRTVKRFTKCGHCGYRSYVLGEEVELAWKRQPYCPRCLKESSWQVGSAAPADVRDVDGDELVVV